MSTGPGDHFNSRLKPYIGAIRAKANRCDEINACHSHIIALLRGSSLQLAVRYARLGAENITWIALIIDYVQIYRQFITVFTLFNSVINDIIAA